MNEKREKKLKEEQEKQEKEEKEKQKKLASQQASGESTATAAGEGTSTAQGSSTTPAASEQTMAEAPKPTESPTSPSTEMVVEPSTAIAETTAVGTTEESRQQQQTELHIEEIPASTTLESSEQASMMIVVNTSAPEGSAATADSQPPATEMTEVAATNQTEATDPQYDLQLIMNARAAEGTTETAPVSTSAPGAVATTEPSTPGAAGPSTTRTPSPFATPAEREAATNFLINFVGATTSVFTVTSAEESRIAQEALRMAEQQRGALELQAAAENSATTYPQNYVLLDGHVVELPAGKN